MMNVDYFYIHKDQISQILNNLDQMEVNTEGIFYQICLEKFQSYGSYRPFSLGNIRERKNQLKDLISQRKIDSQLLNRVKFVLQQRYPIFQALEGQIQGKILFIDEIIDIFGEKLEGNNQLQDKVKNLSLLIYDLLILLVVKELTETEQCQQSKINLSIYQCKLIIEGAKQTYKAESEQELEKTLIKKLQILNKMRPILEENQKLEKLGENNSLIKETKYILQIVAKYQSLCFAQPLKIRFSTEKISNMEISFNIQDQLERVKIFYSLQKAQQGSFSLLKSQKKKVNKQISPQKFLKKEELQQKKQILKRQIFNIEQQKDQLQRQKQILRQYQQLILKQKYLINEGRQKLNKERYSFARQQEKIVEKREQLQKDEQNLKIRLEDLNNREMLFIEQKGKYSKETKEMQEVKVQIQKQIGSLLKHLQILRSQAQSLKKVQQKTQDFKSSYEKDLEKLRNEVEQMKKGQLKLQNDQIILQKDRQTFNKQKESFQNYQQKIMKQKETLVKNQIALIKIKKENAETILNLYSKGLKEINLTNYINVKQLHLAANKLHKIDLSTNTKLVKLYINDNRLTHIDLRKNTQLTHLNLQKNPLSQLDLSHNTRIQGLQLYRNQMERLNLWFHPEFLKFGIQLQQQRSQRFDITFLCKKQHEQNCKAFIKQESQRFKPEDPSKEASGNHFQCEYIFVIQLII